MTKVFLFLAPDESTELSAYLHQLLIDDGYTVVPNAASNGRVRLDLSCDVFVMSAGAAALQENEPSWQQIVEANKPVILVKTAQTAIPLPLRIYNTVDFTHDQDAGVQQFYEQLQWLADPILDRFYMTIHAAVGESFSSRLPYIGADELSTTTSVAQPKLPRRWNQRYNLAAVAAVITVIVAAVLFNLLNPEGDEARVIVLTQPPTATVISTTTQTHTATITPEDCCITPFASPLPDVLNLTGTIEPATPTTAVTVLPLLVVPADTTTPTAGAKPPLLIPTNTLSPTVEAALPTVTATSTVTATPTPTLAEPSPPTPERPSPRGAPELDADKDGIIDIDEVEIYGTNMNNPDTDGDGIPDGVEVFIYFTDPLKTDTDGDGLSDAEEIRKGTDPNSPESN